MKVVINRCFGGFSLSDKAEAMFSARKGIDAGKYLGRMEEYRSDPDLIAVVEELGTQAASGRFAELKIVQIPDETDYVISEYDGMESVAERHTIWE